MFFANDFSDNNQLFTEHANLEREFSMPLVLNKDVFSQQAVLNFINARAEKQNREQTRNGPGVAFFPEGTHIIRWFFDPTGLIFREAVAGRVGKKRFICPDFMFKNDKTSGRTYPVCELDRIAKEQNIRKGKCRYYCMIYGYVYKTDAENDYWKPNRAYVIIGNRFLSKGLEAMINNLKDVGLDMLTTMLTPTSKGFFSTVTATDIQSAQGQVSIQVLPTAVDPIDLGDWYIPLSEVYIPKEFDEEVYQEALREFMLDLPPEAYSNEESAVSEEETIVISRPTATPVVASPLAEALPAPVVDPDELSPRVTSGAKKTTKKKVESSEPEIELPANITLEMLPSGCPGWGNYSTELMACSLCKFNLECLSAGDARS